MIIILMVTGVNKEIKSLDTEYHWPLFEVGAPQAWNYTQGDPEIVLAVIDSGIDFTHPDLENQSWVNLDEIPENGIDDDRNGFIDDIIGWDFRGSDNNPSPGHPHGTFIAGIISGDDDNDLMVGIAPNIKLMAIRFLDDNNAFSGDDWEMFANAINYSVENGAQIIQLSIEAFGTPPSEFYNTIKNAYDNGVTIVGVTGNYGDHVTYPGKYPEVIAVSATTETREIADFSNQGEENEICAPGKDIYSIIPGSTSYATGSGTSFASPLVSGTIALMLSLNRTLTPDTIRLILHESSTDLGELGKDATFGYGLLNASAAVEKVLYEWNHGLIPTTSSTTHYTSGFSNKITPHSSVLLSSSCLFILAIANKKNKR